MSTVERQTRKFTSLNEVIADAESLLAHGYDQAGNWELAQVCDHLAEWLRFPLDGFPKTPLLLQPVFWLVRSIAGKRMRTKIVTDGMPAARPTLRQTVFSPGGDAVAAVARLKDAASRFSTHTGPVHASPLFGTMTRDEALQLQLKHCEHHLSFLVPRTE